MSEGASFLLAKEANLCLKQTKSREICGFGQVGLEWTMMSICCKTLCFSGDGELSLKTKFGLTVVSMICTLCILLLGIWVVVQQSKGGVVNSAKLLMENVEGTLICSRYGAGEQDYEDVIIYSQASGLHEDRVEEIFESTNFAKDSHEIVYVLYFKFDQTCETETWINLEDVSLDNTDSFGASYKFSLSETEPEDWSKAQNISGTIPVGQDNPYLWIRISLNYLEQPVLGAVERASWGFKLQFFGNMRTIVE